MILCVAEVVAHVSLLRLPYYWDEAGYYIPAAYDFFRSGRLIPYSTLTNAHPPLLSVYLAGLWKVFGFAPLVTRVGMLALAATGLTAVYRLAWFALRSTGAAVAATVLTALYPVWFAQGSLAHADLPAAAAALWGLVFLWCSPNKRALLWACGCFCIAGLSKETAIGTPLLLAGWEAWLLVPFVQKKMGGQGDWKRMAALAFPVIPLACWYGYHHWRTGFTFGNPEFLRYNAQTTTEPLRVLIALGQRALHLSVNLNLFVVVVIGLASLLLPRLPERTGMDRELRWRLWVLVVGNGVFFSLLGGALLTRYLLPEYAFVLLLLVAAVHGRFRRWAWFPALGAIAFVAALTLQPPYRVAPEDTLLYRDTIELQQHAIAVVQARYPHGAVLTAWPVEDELRKPELGYVSTPMPVTAIDNFSLGALQGLVNRGVEYQTAIVFSTKYEPLHPWFRIGEHGEALERKYFAMHRDLPAEDVAALLHGEIVWSERRGAEWIAVLRFAHPQLAMR